MRFILAPMAYPLENESNFAKFPSTAGEGGELVILKQILGDVCMTSETDGLLPESTASWLHLRAKQYCCVVGLGRQFFLFE
jgi:hypothetical protein